MYIICSASRNIMYILPTEQERETMHETLRKTYWGTTFYTGKTDRNGYVVWDKPEFPK